MSRPASGLGFKDFFLGPGSIFVLVGTCLHLASNLNRVKLKSTVLHMFMYTEGARSTRSRLDQARIQNFKFSRVQAQKISAGKLPTLNSHLDALVEKSFLSPWNHSLISNYNKLLLE